MIESGSLNICAVYSRALDQSLKNEGSREVQTGSQRRKKVSARTWVSPLIVITRCKTVASFVVLASFPLVAALRNFKCPLVASLEWNVIGSQSGPSNISLA